MRPEESALFEALSESEWYGTALDHPEGSRYIKLSETQVKKLIKGMLSLHADKIRKCLVCGKSLFFITLPTGTQIPYTEDGRNHLKICTYQPQGPKPEQSVLFNTAVKTEYPG